jgi:acetoin utilization protein AcuC
MRDEPPAEFLPPYFVELFLNEVGYVPLSYPDAEMRPGEKTQERIAVELARTLESLKRIQNEIHPGKL